MLVFALVLGILGALSGLGIGTLLFIGDLVTFASDGSTQVRGLVMLLLAVVSFVGAVRALRKPWQGAALLLFAGIGSLVVIDVFGTPVFFFTLLGAISAIRGRKEM